MINHAGRRYLEAQFVFVHEVEKGVGLQPFQKFGFGVPEALPYRVFQRLVVAVDVQVKSPSPPFRKGGYTGICPAYRYRV